MTKVQVTIVVAMLACGKAWGLDEFSGLKCRSDIPKALIGKRFVNQRVVVIEEAHKDLGLEDLGGTEISDRLFLISWRICGMEYQLLEDVKSNIIRDVLPFPSHSKTSPEAIGLCQTDGRRIPETIIAVLDNSAGHVARNGLNAKTLLNATSAWEIDETHQRFQSLTSTQVACPLDAIVTLDGGP
jgi:hypothetical protein